MKFRSFIIGIVIILTIIILTQFYLKGNKSDSNWIQDLNYEENQIHDVSFGLFNPCPYIPVKIGDKEVEVLFDTGNGAGIFITTALEGKVEYEIVGKTIELNGDGTYRGEGKSVLLESINVFGEEYTNIIASFTDWRMYGFFKNNGAIGLEYFKNKVLTLDYRNKKLAVSSEALDYSKLQKDKYTIIPLISCNLSNEKHLLFFEGEVNGEKSTIYLDTGSNRSFINVEDAKVVEVEVKLGDRKYKFNSNHLKQEEISFEDEFEYPIRLAINSDLLKTNHFVITIDKIQNNLVIYQN
ncbi:MAG: hypothetical protein ACYDEX_07030 [Mobilitalea sp.]